MHLPRRLIPRSAFLATLLSSALGRAQAPAATAPEAGPPPPAGGTERSFIDELRLEELASNPLSHWLILLAAITVAVAAGKIVSWLLRRLAQRLERRRWHGQAQVFAGLASPATLALFSLGLSIGLAWIKMSDPLRTISGRILLLLYTMSAFWYAFNLVAVVEVAIKRFAQRTETTLDDELVPVIRKALRIFIIVIGALFILQNVFNRDIGAWLAGLGIAGLAVSLAAQDSLKNLFGSITILFDRPFALGQRILYGKYDGVVEEIGFRSTKIRTPDGSLVTIPNSNIVNDPVDNWQVRPRIFRTFIISITYDTPVAKVREAVEIVRRIFADPEFQPFIHDEDTKRNEFPPRVFFMDMAADNLALKVWYWYRPADWWTYCDFNQRFNLRLMEEYEKAGIEFAFPTRTLYLAGDPKRHLELQMRDVDGENLAAQQPHPR